MQCVTPMFRRYESGNHKKGTVVSRKEVLEELIYDPNYIRFCLDNLNDYSRRHNGKYLYEQIPCGHCYACKLNYAAQWAGRIMMECSEHEHNYFVTFTYDEEHLPIPERSEYEGVIYENDGTWNGTLMPLEMTKFIHDLRQYLDRKYGKEYDEEGIRINVMKYFYAGEYGSLNMRPHYHMILMNCPLDITQFYDFNIDERGKTHWKSKELEKYWNKGFVDVAEVEFASAAYVARYCMKKITDLPDKTEYWAQGKQPEFVRMSRRPGIGMKYLEEHMEEIYKYDSITLKNFHGETICVKPSKAWDKKIEKIHPDWMPKIKQSRKAAAERSRRLLQEITDATDAQQLLMQADNIAKKSNMLPREL